MIKNACDRTLSESPDVPEVSDAINGNLQKVSIETICRIQTDGRTQELPRKKFSVMASKQPYKPQEADIREEGYRAWKWFTIHVSQDLGVKINDIIILREIEYRVMSALDANEYGFIKYTVCQGFENA
jgi:hypothetical protein